MGVCVSPCPGRNGHNVLVWTRNSAQEEEINLHHTNTRRYHLNDESLNPQLKATSDIQQAGHSSIYLMAIPTAGIRHLLRRINPLLEEPSSFIHGSKGLEQQTHKKNFNLIEEEIIVCAIHCGLVGASAMLKRS